MFDYGYDLWAATIIAVLIKLKASGIVVKTSKFLTVFGVVSTIFISIASGMLLHVPLMELFGLSESWTIPMAILVALTAENLMKTFVDISGDSEQLKSWLSVIITRKSQ